MAVNLMREICTLLVGVLLALAVDAYAQTASPEAAAELGGTSWQLVRFQGSNDKTLTPDDPSKYTIAFSADGRVIARIDCNRGRGTWTSTGPNQLQFSPLALTRAMCPPGSLHDRIGADWELVRSYIVKDGHLFLSLAADGGIYELEPIAGTKPSPPRSPVGSKGPVRYDCARTGGGSDTLIATFYDTTPGLVLVERRNQMRPAFQVVAASGAKYEGRDLVFWDAHGEALVVWSGVELKCKRR